TCAAVLACINRTGCTGPTECQMACGPEITAASAFLALLTNTAFQGCLQTCGLSCADGGPGDAGPDTTPPQDVRPDTTPPQDAQPDTTPPQDATPDTTPPQDAQPDTTPPQDAQPDTTPPQDATPDTTPSDATPDTASDTAT